MKLRIIACIIWIVGSLPILGQEVVNLSASDEQLLDDVGNLYLRTNQVPGMGIGVLKNGRVLYSKGLGIKDKNTGEPVTNRTIFHHGFRF